jgi:aspartate kinase
MKTIKIGGSNFSNTEDFISLIDYFRKKNGATLNIISAFGKLSHQLKEYTLSYANFDPQSNPFDIFKPFFSVLGGENRVGFEEYMNSTNKLLQTRIEGLRATGELHHSVLDEILSYGELVSSHFIFYLLKSHHIDCELLDSRELIKTDSNFGNAKPDIEKSISNIKARLDKDKTYIVQGFIASDSKGRTTTMGFESSNLSAMIYSKAVASQSIEIITKVNQIRSFDPQLSDGARGVGQIPYSSAKVLADSNFKLLFPGIIDMADKFAIEIIYRGLSSDKKTIISGSEEFDYPVVFPLNDKIIIAPLKFQDAIRVLNRFESNLTDISYETASHCLKLNNLWLEAESVHNFIISLF